MAGNPHPCWATVCPGVLLREEGDGAPISERASRPASRGIAPGSFREDEEGGDSPAVAGLGAAIG